MRKSRPHRSVSPSQIAPGPSTDPVPTAPIQHTTDAATPAPFLLGTLPQRHLGVSAPQTPSPRRHHRQKSSPSSLSNSAHTPIGRVNNAPNRCVTLPSGIFFSDVPRSSPTISFFVWRLATPPPLSEGRASAAISRLYRDDDGILLLVRKLALPPRLVPTILATRCPPLTRRS